MATKRTTQRLKATSLDKVSRSLAPAERAEPFHDDPRKELKRLVKIHQALTKTSVATGHMSSDRENRETRVKIPCLLPETDKMALDMCSKELSKSAARLETLMLAECKKLPVYDAFLKNIWGLKTGVCVAYLLANIDIHRCEKPSQLIRYCGYAIIDGRLERRATAPKYDFQGNYNPGGGGTYNAEMRTRLYQAFNTMFRSSGGDKRRVRTKYLDILHSKRERLKLSDRVHGNKIKLVTPYAKKNEAGKTVMMDEASLAGFALRAGWHTAVTCFLYDLYMVWRAIEGLPIWVTYYEWARGYEHNGPPVERENHPRHMSLEEVLHLIGPTGILPGSADQAVNEVPDIVAAE